MVKKKAAAKKPASKFSRVMEVKRKLLKPFRDLEQDGVTYSFLTEFLTCREQARLSYVEGYTQKNLVEALEFGSAFHLCLEMATKKDPYIHQKAIAKHKKDRLKHLPSQADRKQLDHVMKLVAAVWPKYWDYWFQRKAMEHQPNTKFICMEESFREIHTLPNGRKIILRGRFDAVMDYKGQVWLMENKTKSVVDERITDYLPHDLQTMLYCHVAKQKYGRPVQGILYNVARRPMLRPGKNETMDDFYKRVAADVEERGDFYFLRYNVMLEEGDVARWVNTTLEPLLTQVCLWWDEIKQNPFDPWNIPNRVHHFRNPEGLYTKFGKSPYFDFLTNGNDYLLTRRAK